MDLPKYCSANMREYTYIGIGSKNRVNNVEDFNADMDQIMPCFLNTVPNKTIRAIHFDPLFENDTNNFLTKYFNSKEFTETKIGVHRAWVSTNLRIEVIIVADMFDENTTFLRDMIRLTIDHKTQMVVQLYNGQELAPLFQNLYYMFANSEKKYISQNVLFDITYGGESHCMTPMSKHFPMVDNNGKFYNFLLYDEQEMLSSIGILPKMDKLIENYIMKKLSTILNENHVNYRKSVRGEAHLFKSKDYGMFASPDEIMAVLLTKTRCILDILSKLGSLTIEKQDLFNTCSNNYKDIDMYKWYSDMTKLYK